MTESKSINSNTAQNFDITFNIEFEKVPIVVASAVEATGSGVPIIRVFSVTTTGCTVRVYNNTSSGTISSLRVSWIAMSK